MAKARARLAELEKAEDDYARLVEITPSSPRLWIDRGRRLGELARWDEAAKAFDRAVKLKQKDVKETEVWKERGRAYADLGKWDEATADFVKALELAPTKKSDWLAGSDHVRDQVVRLEEVFARVAKLRPTDRQLWIERVHYLSRTAHWPEAAQAIARVAELDPEDHLTWYFRAHLHVYLGDMEGFREDCRKLAPFGKTSNLEIARRVAMACLLAPQEVEAFAPAILTMKRLGKNQINPVYWYGVTLGLGHYREGQSNRAIEVVTSLSRSNDYEATVGLACQALAEHKQLQPNDARRSLAQARGRLARIAQPGLTQAQSQWWSWMFCRIIVREAETLIPTAQAVAQTPSSTAQDYAAQRDRKARADSLATQAALAQIRLDVGQKTEAEAELRTILAEREAIVAEEPGNLDYQADLAAAHDQLGQFLVSDGRVEDGVKETQRAVALLEQFAAGNPRVARFQVNLAANLFSVGDYHWKAGRLAEGRQAWQRALESLKVARGAATKDPKVAKMAVDLELVAGRAYVDLGLWTEASEHFRRVFDVDPAAGKVTDRYQHAALLVLTGDEAAYRRYCTRVYERSGADMRDWYSAKMMVLRPGALPDSKSVVALVQETRNVTKDRWWTALDHALAQLRADQSDAFATLQEFEKISKSAWQFSWPSLALARHKAGKTDEAREWLRKTEDWYAGTWSKHLAADSTGLPKDGGSAFWTFFLNLRQEAIATVTGQPAPADAWLHLHRGRVYARLGLPDKANAEFQAAVKARPDDPRIVLSRGRVYASLGKSVEAQADRARAIHMTQQVLAKRPEDADAADTLAGLLLEKVETKWTALKPLAVKSEGGATLTVQPDNSVLVSGKSPDRDFYTVEADVDGPVFALKLEALTDSTLPNNGPGRADNGNFHLHDIRVSIVPGGEIVWAKAIADFEQKDMWVRHAIDAAPNSAWGVEPMQGKSHWAVFLARNSVGSAGKSRITVRLDCLDEKWVRHTLGRFRLSVAGESDMIQQSGWFLAAATPHAKVAAAYLVIDDAKGAADFLTKATAANPEPLPSEWLVLALAQARLKDTDQARRACAKAAEMLKRTGGDAALRPLLREVAVTLGTNHAEVRQLIAAAAGQPPAALNEAIQKNPDKAAGYKSRGNWYGERGRWKEAIADLAEEFRLEPNAHAGMRLGFLLVQTGDADRCRAHGEAALERWAATDNPSEANQTLKMILLRPDFKADAKQLARLAEVSVSGDQTAPLFEWKLNAKGLHDYRTGRYAEALTACRESRRRAPQSKGSPQTLIALNLVIEAMARHRSDDAAGARRTLAEAKATLDGHVPGIDAAAWHDWLAAHILFREAEGLIASKKTEK